MIIRKRIARGKDSARHTKKRKKKSPSPVRLLRAAADPGKRAVMTKVWKRRRRRAEVLSGAVRIAIRYLNAKDQKTVYRR